MSEPQKQKLLAAGPLISLASAAEFTPYTAEYLSLLARKNRLAAIKISRDWLTTKQAVTSYTSEQKIKHWKFFQKFGFSENTSNESSAVDDEGRLA